MIEYAELHAHSGFSFLDGSSDPEELVAEAHRLGLAALALTGDASRGGDVLPRLNAWGQRFADTYKALNRGAHAPHDGDLGLLVADARSLVGRIRAMLP